MNGVESINPEEAEVTHDNLSLELNQEYSKLRGGIKEELDKLRRFESAAQILVGNQQKKCLDLIRNIAQGGSLPQSVVDKK